jgi:hypothetical protein
MTLVGGPTSAIARIPLDSTSYAHRDALLTFELVDQVLNGNGTYPADGLPFVNGFVDALTSATPLVSGQSGMGVTFDCPVILTVHYFLDCPVRN